MSDDQKYAPQKRGFLNLTNRVVWSWRGCVDTWQNEPSFKSWVYVNLLSDVLVFVLPVPLALRALIVVLGVLILAMELMNTAIERLADLVEPRENVLIRACKDAGSAAVAVAAIAGGVAWIFAVASLV